MSERTYKPITTTLHDLATTCPIPGADETNVLGWMKELEMHGYIWTEVEPIKKTLLTIHISCVDHKPQSYRPLGLDDVGGRR